MWKPTQEQIRQSQMYRYFCYVQQNHNAEIKDYSDLHRWSINSPETFWRDLLDFFDVICEGESEPVGDKLGWEHYGWFPHLRLNYAENLLKKGHPSSSALVSINESGQRRELSYGELRDSVQKMQTALSSVMEEGDVLAAYMPNIPETVISMLACTSLGGTFTSTSCDFGVESVVDRFGQTNPKVLVTVDGYQYNGKHFELREKIETLIKRLPSLEKIVVVNCSGRGESISGTVNWETFLSGPVNSLKFRRVTFASPLFVMYSSGTTGKPKAIVHGTGGVLLQHLKELILHNNLEEQDNIFYFTTCGWMMWNWLVSSLYTGSRVTLYEGSPSYPTLASFVEMIECEKITHWGTSPKFLRALKDSGYSNNHSLASLQTIISTGAPLLPEQFDFIYDHVKKDLRISSICGGTDILGCFMLGNPMLPVQRGEITSLGLGMDVVCFDPFGKRIFDTEGELVCRQSFPSRPLHFLKDPDGAKIKRAYFERFPNVWHHGDFISINKSSGGVQVFGRSDTTLNPGGIRIGTAEIYRQIENLSFLEEGLCVGKNSGEDVEIVLFVKMFPHENLTEERIGEIKKAIRSGAGPHHVPRHIYEVSDIPYTRSGKKMELLISRIINSRQPDNLEAVANPECLKEYQQFS